MRSTVLLPAARSLIQRSEMLNGKQIFIEFFPLLYLCCFHFFLLFPVHLIKQAFLDSLVSGVGHTTSWCCRLPPRMAGVQQAHTVDSFEVRDRFTKLEGKR